MDDVLEARERYDETARLERLSAADGVRRGGPLAARAEVAGPVHPGAPADRRAAAAAGLALAAVGVQRAVEVAGLAVDVDVEAVEAGAAGGERRRSSRRGRGRAVRRCAAG